MKLTGLHFLLSYRCTHECEHCFLWSSPRARGTMTLAQVRAVLDQAKEVGTVTSVCFEGGEPFLFYPIMIEGLREAAAMGLGKGIVSNCYWATSIDDALEWLRPIAEIGIESLAFSSDLFHGETTMTDEARNAVAAAKRLGLPETVYTIEPPEGCDAYPEIDKGEPITGGSVRFRGRAVAKLTGGVERRPWSEFTECPGEDFADLGRVHVDAFGNVHLCQGLVIGNLWQRPLKDIVADYDPVTHPVIGPLHTGGPVALVEQYNLPHEDGYADACHLCYLARDALRRRFPESLTPGQVYGELAG
jgi:MoaA/NifB/PqqE/SkfB family radical SAM enzyme